MRAIDTIGTLLDVSRIFVIESVSDLEYKEALRRMNDVQAGIMAQSEEQYYSSPEIRRRKRMQQVLQL
jgi:hypothetical protein